MKNTLYYYNIDLHKSDIISYKSESAKYLGIYKFEFCLTVDKYISENCSYLLKLLLLIELWKLPPKVSSIVNFSLKRFF